MSLKQDIVVVNEFSVPLGDGKGSRGGTPGNYVSRYMARPLATETVTPIRLSSLDSFVTRYMAREDAVESVIVPDRQLVKKKMSAAQKEGGVAFGYGEFSLSNEQLQLASKDIQKHFDNGHTVLKTVLSFSPEYLERQGIVEPGFKLKKRGGYRGHIDQLKMRLAIMHGLERLGGRYFDDLRYVGTIQVDTNHVHCHLALVDAGRGRKAKDGTQKGKLTKAMFSLLRRGIDSYLDEKQVVAYLSSSVGFERRNVISYVKRWAHEQVLKESLPQLLLATLPEDRNLWRYGTNAKSMRKPNRIVTELVEEVLALPGSPLGSAIASVTSYANERRELEGLSDKEWAKLIDYGREQITERGVNAVYASLKQLPEEYLRVKTPILDVMGMDYTQLVQDNSKDERNDLVGFAFRLRSYSARLQEHVNKREQAQEQMRLWEIQNLTGQASKQSEALYRWWEFEEGYHGRLASKYRFFLPAVVKETKWNHAVRELQDYHQRYLSLVSMTNDASLKKISDPEIAEHMGYQIYGQRGGRLVAQNDKESRSRLKARIEAMASKEQEMLRELRKNLANEGRVLLIEDGKYVASEGEEFSFQDVKGLDLHHMGFDFSKDMPMSPRVKDLFVTNTHLRMDLLIAAVEYLEETGQSEAIELLDVDEVTLMNKMMALLEKMPAKKPYLPSEIARLAELSPQKRSGTFYLGSGLAQATTKAVDDEIQKFDAKEALEVVVREPDQQGMV